MNKVLIRPETPADHRAVYDLIVKVFHETYGTGQAEADVVKQLRELVDLGPIVSLVAMDNETLVGQIFISSVTITDFPDIPVCTLGPVGVYAKWQRQGIGSRLITEGLALCKERGYKAAFTAGSLEYYPRFGFVPIGETRCHTIFRTDHDMAMELEPGILEQVSGPVFYPEPWHVFIEE